MGKKQYRLHVRLTATERRALDELAEELGLDDSNTIRHCLKVMLDEARARKIARDNRQKQDVEPRK